MDVVKHISFGGGCYEIFLWYFLETLKIFWMQDFLMVAIYS